ncbi:hypothetical protein JYK22_19510, partial [Nonomuraea sp. RK-328]|nr:hypothetical protein [Nonomuraea sp. RK-328]
MPLRRAGTLVPGPEAAPGPGSAATLAVVTGSRTPNSKSFLIRPALHDPVGDQRLQPAGEQVTGDAEVFHDVVEAVQAEVDVPH